MTDGGAGVDDAKHETEDGLRRRIGELEAANVRLSELNELKNHFLGMAAHDLRNPLGSVKGLADLMLEMNLPADQQRELLHEVSRVSTQMLDLVNDLLDLSAIESGQLELHIAPIDLGELVEERIHLQRIAAGRKHIEINFDRQTVPPVRCDRERMAQVFDNLISNAVKFSPSYTKVSVELSALGVAAVVAVSDRGQGIPEAELHRLFGAFSRLSVRPTAGEKSTGLGLSIVKRIVEEHDGVVGVESKVGKGSSFRVILPL